MVAFARLTVNLFSLTLTEILEINNHCFKSKINIFSQSWTASPFGDFFFTLDQQTLKWILNKLLKSLLYNLYLKLP